MYRLLESPRRIVLLLAVASGIAVAAFFGIRARSGPTDYEPFPVLERHDINGRGRPLTAEQKSEAVEIALADERVRALIGERRVVETVAEGWPVGHVLVGAEVRVIFEGPQVTEGEWLILQPSASELGDGRQVFPSIEFHQAYTGVEALVARIDWESREIAMLMPEGDERVGQPGVQPVGTVAPEVHEEIEAWEEKYGPVGGE